MGKDLNGKELEKGIYQQPNGTFCARYVERSGKRVSKRSKEYLIVKNWLKEEVYNDKHSDLNNASNIIVDAWFEYWIGIKRQTVRRNTVRNHEERYYKNIKKEIGHLIISEVKPAHCQKIFINMAEEEYSSSTINQARITLHNMLEYAKDNDVIKSNPCKKSLKSNIGKTPKKKEALSIEVQRIFLKAIEGYSYENQYRFVLQTGLRTGELIGLCWKDIDFQNKTLQIERTMEYRYDYKKWEIGPPKTKSGYRTIPLTEEAIRILHKQREKNKEIVNILSEWSDVVFLCKYGTPVANSTYDSGLFKCCDRAGIPRFSMHVLRHTFATRCIEGGMKPKTLQKILGHSNIGITMNLYVHITDEEKQKEIDMVADSLNAF